MRNLAYLLIPFGSALVSCAFLQIDCDQSAQPVLSDTDYVYCAIAVYSISLLASKSVGEISQGSLNTMKVRRKSARMILVMLLSVLSIVLMVFLVRQFELEEAWLRLLEYVEATGWHGQLLFMLVVSVCVIALIPSVLLTLGAGMLFGLVKGSFIVVAAETVGAYIAFLVGRRYLPDWMSLLLEKRSLLKAIFELPDRHDWRLVAVIRMLPFFPFKLSNYFFGLTPLTARSYLIGTFVGLWPITLFNVYLGSVASELIQLRAAGDTTSPWQWLLYGVGLAVTGIVMIIAIRRATREIDRRAGSPTI